MFRLASKWMRLYAFAIQLRLSPRRYSSNETMEVVSVSRWCQLYTVVYVYIYFYLFIINNKFRLLMIVIEIINCLIVVMIIIVI